MELDEAVKHCLEVAERNETSAITYKNCKEFKTNMYEKLTAEKAESDCRECAADHRQLAEWLRELKDLREENKVLISECDRLIKEKGELLKKSEQIAEYKRLLKSAVKDFRRATKGCIGLQCDSCPHTYTIHGCVWRYTGKALALAGKDGENNA